MMVNSGNSAHPLVQLIRYAFVGVMNTCVTLLAIFICKSLLGVNPYVSNAIGYGAGIANSFIWNRAWVFHAKEGRLHRQILLFAVGTGACYLIQLLCLYLLLDKTALGDMQWIILGFTLSGYGVATLVGSVVYTGVNFIYNKLIAFRA